MSLKPAKVQFNGGELSPWLEGRTDIAKFDKTAKLCRNFIPLAEGSLKRRGGTHFVAMTPQGMALMFKIIAYPEDATVVINGQERRSILVTRGDKVSFEVRADGYNSQAGEMVVSEKTELTVKLISCLDVCILTVTPVPGDATVKIAGLPRRSYKAPQNTDVAYWVYKDGYKMKSGLVFMNEDKNLTVELELETGSSGEYGDWGRPQYFVSCTAVGRVDVQLKCLCYRFTNGYLMVVFKAGLKVPDEAAEMRFFYTTKDGYNALTYKNNTYYLSCLHTTSDAYYYKDVDGTVISAFTKALEMKVCGWQLDEDKRYASFYARYDGTVTGALIKLYYDGEVVWKLEGRKNG
ncbi:MAG: hypothetical protein NC218_10965 [Acetobacter sp.]|nr:hypothetical protein [Acetobacter sp.]